MGNEWKKKEKGGAILSLARLRRSSRAGRELWFCEDGRRSLDTPLLFFCFHMFRPNRSNVRLIALHHSHASERFCWSVLFGLFVDQHVSTLGIKPMKCNAERPVGVFWKKTKSAEPQPA